METGKKEVATRDNLKIRLAYNDILNESSCGFCGGACKPDGLDFTIEGTKAFVCLSCVKEKAPELYEIHKAAHWWVEDKIKEAFREGEEHGALLGREEAGRLILEELNEPIEVRLKKFIKEKVFPALPFPEDGIPF